MDRSRYQLGTLEDLFFNLLIASFEKDTGDAPGGQDKPFWEQLKMAEHLLQKAHTTLDARSAAVRNSYWTERARYLRKFNKGNSTSNALNEHNERFRELEEELRMYNKKLPDELKWKI